MKSRSRFVAVLVLLIAGLALSSAALLAAPRSVSNSAAAAKTTTNSAVPDATSGRLPSSATVFGTPAILPDGVTPPGVPTFSAQEARAFALTHSPFAVDSPQSLVVTVEFLTAEEVGRRIDEPASNLLGTDNLYCLVTMYGHFSDTGFSRPPGVGAMAGRVGYMIFDAHTGNELIAGGKLGP